MILNKLIKLCIISSLVLPTFVFANAQSSSTQQSIGTDSQTNIRSDNGLDTQLRGESELDAKIRGRQDADTNFRLENKTNTDNDDFVNQRNESSFDRNDEGFTSTPESTIPSADMTNDQGAAVGSDSSMD